MALAIRAFLHVMNDVINARLRFGRRSGAVAVTAVLVVLAGCSAVSPAAGPDPTVPTTTAPTNLVSSTSSAGSVRIVVRFGEEQASATLADTSAARDFAAMLPLELDLRDPMGQAKSGELPWPIEVSGAEPVSDPSVGELYYWAPSGTLAIFYDDLGHSVPPPGLVRLGAVDSGLAAISTAGNRFRVRIEPADRTVS